jgi:pyrimidine operon attenuation protein/uracil phosphoribosyltransferase
MSKTQNQILTENQVNNILKRMAFEILENNYHESQIFIIGISGQGTIMGSKLVDLLKNISRKLSIEFLTLSIDKTDPIHSEIELSRPLSELENATIIIVDDVLNTGRTQAYALSYLMKATPKSIQTAILVNRSHTLFPISVTYSGIALSTTIDDHIEVKLENKVGAYLS